jgi:hypothetical protein
MHTCHMEHPQHPGVVIMLLDLRYSHAPQGKNVKLRQTSLVRLVYRYCEHGIEFFLLVAWCVLVYGLLETGGCGVVLRSV